MSLFVKKQITSNSPHRGIWVFFEQCSGFGLCSGMITEWPYLTSMFCNTVRVQQKNTEP